MQSSTAQYKIIKTLNIFIPHTFTYVCSVQCAHHRQLACREKKNSSNKLKNPVQDSYAAAQLLLSILILKRKITKITTKTVNSFSHFTMKTHFHNDTMKWHHILSFAEDNQFFFISLLFRLLAFYFNTCSLDENQLETCIRIINYLLFFLFSFIQLEMCCSSISHVFVS